MLQTSHKARAHFIFIFPRCHGDIILPRRWRAQVQSLDANALVRASRFQNAKTVSVTEALKSGTYHRRVFDAVHSMCSV